MVDRFAPTHFRSFTYGGREYHFGASNPDDAIQGTLLAGNFFVQYEFDAIAERLPSTGLMADVGANVGNHTVYLAARNPDLTVLPFEPNEEARTLLKHNVEANGLGNVDLSHVEVALSDTTGTSMMQRGSPNNLGGTRIVPDEGVKDATGTRRERWFQEVRLARGDDVLADHRVDFIKVDTEGHKMPVLAGLERTIARDRPTLFVEVDKSNLDEFDSWMERAGYRRDWSDHRYAAAENLIAVPVDGTARAS